MLATVVYYIYLISIQPSLVTFNEHIVWLNTNQARCCQQLGILVMSRITYSLLNNCHHYLITDHLRTPKLFIIFIEYNLWNSTLK